MSPIDQLYLKHKNYSSKERKSNALRLRILKTIFENRTITIGEIATKINLSFPTLNAIISELTLEGLIEQKEKGESIGGRKPNLYQLCNEVFNILSVEVERFTIRLIVLDNNHNTVYSSRSYPNPLSKNSADIEDLTNIIQRYIEEECISWNKITSIGILMPGLINSSTGENRTFYTSTGFNLQAHLEHVFNKHIFLLNDVKSAALSELNYGAAQGLQNVLIIQMDWGIGLGIIINGEVYMGSEGFSGEVGHMVFVEDGQLCYCGKRGCLETVASGVALVSRAREDIAQFTPTLLSTNYNVETLLPQDIIEAAHLGDQYAIDLIYNLGKNLGKAISYLIQLFNPQLIVMSGKFAAAGSLITLPIQQGIQTYTMNALKNNCKLQVSTLGANGFTKGIVLYTITRHFDKLIEAIE
ncbi:ROK family transcriptional regulator [Sphingobacterium alkalisoli]|uniref:ROK family transcriptional regulator n=1 Tax=Sphingobacterium alkalisoli TaxID=1874115 RepID=A0A4U0GYG4_9SPHI|nr:ROK family transcriptional regulator [Sphingobacterium alkalisoli]TJY64203.1 ROK family transcriptional regulator [Sphingobacterium alkalisoli]GGH23190.1 transcriptional regulator [Sphingobacterium alkalisoli]